MAVRSRRPEPELISLADAAHMYGVSILTLRRRIADGSLPAVRLRRGRDGVDESRLPLRVKPADVEALYRPVPTTTRTTA